MPRKLTYQIYEDKDAGYSIQYPEGWEVREAKKEVSVGFVAPLESEYDKFLTHKVRRLDRVINVSVPQYTDDDLKIIESDHEPEIRDSIRIQSLLATIGDQMGFNVWIPRNDRTSVKSELKNTHHPILETLPLNYDDTTLRTIENIDVLWLKGEAMVCQGHVLPDKDGYDYGYGRSPGCS